MSTRPDLDRSISEWLVAQVPDEAPERLLEASRARIRTTQQRRAWWPARRVPTMNKTVPIVLAAAAVTVIAIIGFQVLGNSNVAAPAPSDTTSPSFAPTPSSTPIPSASPSEASGPVDFTELAGGGTELEPGEYVIDYASPVALVRFTVADEPDGTRPSPWYKGQHDWGPWHQSNAARLGVADVENLYLDPCVPSDGLHNPAVGPSAADLVAALGEVPGLVHGTPVETGIGGLSGLYMELTGELPADCVEEPWIWTTTGGDATLLMPAAGDLVHMWIYDIEGRRLVIWVGEDEGFDDPGENASVEALLESIVIEVP